jgi:replicative DNA helicase
VKTTTPKNVSATEAATKATSASSVLARLMNPHEVRLSATPARTGFDLLDLVMEGGLRAHDLMVLGGNPGVGKTVAALQMARRIAQQGRPVLYASFEHDTDAMLGRLLALETMALEHGLGDGGVLVVDYLQKVAVIPPCDSQDERIARVTEDLKDLTLRHRMAVIAIASADLDGLRAGRLRLHHLRGSAALAYECDVAVILNHKQDAVATEHLAYDPVRAESFKQLVVFSVEKNRGGPAMVDMEFQKDFPNYRLEPEGSYLLERLMTTIG